MIDRSSPGFWMSLVFGGSVVSAVFFQGFYTEFLCLSLALLVVCGVWAVWASYAQGISLPVTSVTVAFALYWAWLAVAGTIGRVQYQGTISFWWLSALPLTFWIFILSPHREDLWRYGYRWAVFIGVGLAIVASCQWLIFGLEPQATFLNRQSLAALLNLIAIPLAGYFLIADPSRRLRRWALGIAVFLLALSLAVIEGRGATMAGAAAFLLLMIVALRFVPRRHVGLLVAIVAAAFLIGSQVGRVGLGQRLDTVIENPWDAGGTRLVIWKQSWEMLKQSPWTGVGLGHYALHWPPYRDPSDSSDGFFVHNDYLQIWIEAGLPGLLLIVAVLLAVLVMYIRAMRSGFLQSSTKMEMTALFAGLFATAAHSVVDFNLYILSILLLAGLMLGRLYVLAYAGQPVQTFNLAPAKLLSERGYRIVTASLSLFVLFYFLMLGLASFEYRRGLALAEQSDWDAAYATLQRADRYYPYADNVPVSRADFLRHILTQIPSAEETQRSSLFNEAQDLLARAERINPLRAQTFVVRGVLLEQNPALAGSSSVASAMDNYHRAIEIEPRSYHARYLHARLLLTQGRREEAHRLLEDGAKYAYPAVDSIVPYYALTAQLREQAGDAEGASGLKARIEQIRKGGRTTAHAPGPLFRLIAGD